MRIDSTGEYAPIHLWLLSYTIHVPNLSSSLLRGCGLPLPLLPAKLTRRRGGRLPARIKDVGRPGRDLLAVCGVSNSPVAVFGGVMAVLESIVAFLVHRRCKGQCGILGSICIPATLVVHASVIDFFFPYYH